MNLQRGFLLFLLGILGFISWLMLKPFLAYILMAIILAFVLFPAQRRLETTLGESLTAVFLIMFALAALLVPFGLTSAAVIADAQDLADDLNESNIVNTTRIEQNIHEYTGRTIDIENEIDRIVDRFTDIAFGSVTQILEEVTAVLIGVTLMLFIAYYLLKDGDGLVEWLIEASPLPDDVERGIAKKTRNTTWAVIKGHVLVAFIQGIVAGIGLLITGVPNFVFWTFVMILLGFIPIIGATVVWLPASVYLFVIGRPGAAIFLFLYGVLAVGLTDNIVRPIAVDRGSDLHPAVIIIGVIGGVYLFGAPGLFIGPIILGVFKSILIVFRENYEDL